MTERLPSDHDAVETHRIHVETVGATSRLRLPLPPGLSVDADDVVRLSLAGDPVHAPVRETLGGDPVLADAFDNRRLARADDEGADRLGAWLADEGVEAGEPLLLDVVTPGYAFGLRRPGDRVVYDAVEPPAETLSDIARDLDG